MKEKAQWREVARILEERGAIDNFWSIETKFCLRLAARVEELRSMGYLIETKKLPNKNCRYTLIAKPAPVQMALERV